jgi:hypothetical protein
MRIAIAIVMLLATACEPELGPCDSSTVRRLVFDEGGGQVYEGQALMISSCGFGGFCHSSNIDAEDRHGAPYGMEYDVRLIFAEGDDEEVSAARLRRNWEAAFAHRRAIWGSVGRGQMPIRGAEGISVSDAAPEYVWMDPRTDMPVEIPTLDSPDGRETLRNWLACGLPIVSRSEPSMATTPPPALGDTVPPYEVTPLEPRWADIYERMISRRCASAPCHGSAREGELQLDDPATALSNLVGMVSRGDDCMSGGAMLIAPGDPDHSLLVNKLEGHDANGEVICGRSMPVGGSRVSDASMASIRQWIMEGARAQ